jgi:hypothetical protein
MGTRELSDTGTGGLQDCGERRPAVSRRVQTSPEEVGETRDHVTPPLTDW